MFQCVFCGVSYDTTKGYTTHIRRSEKQNFNGELELVRHLCYVFYGQEEVLSLISRYETQEICTHELSIAHSYVVQLITLMGLKRTNSQEKLTERYKNKYLTTIKQKYGDEYTNVSQVPEIRQKIDATLASKYGSVDDYYKLQIQQMYEGYRVFASDPNRVRERRQKHEASLLSKYGVTNSFLIPHVREKRSARRKERDENLTAEQRRLLTQKARESVKYESSLEVRVRKCLVEMGEDFIAHQFLWGYNFDVMIRGKVLIEVNGDFWHANPNIYKESDILLGDLTAKKIWAKDKRKVDKALSEGYRVITLWESDLQRITDEALIHTLREFIQNARRSRRCN